MRVFDPYLQGKHNFFVTGGSGFIGTNLIEHLRGISGASVLNADILPPKLASHRQYWKNVDIRSQTSLRQCIEEFSPTFVFHLAARTDLDGKSLEDYDSNHIGTANVADSLMASGFSGVAIFASSMYVCTPGYQPMHARDYCPHTIYGESKVQSETALYNKEISFPWHIVRPTSIWGPWFGEPYRRFFEVVSSGRFLKMRNRQCFRTYGYVDNAVLQMIAIAATAAQRTLSSRMFYLGDRDIYEISQWADEIALLAGKKNLPAPYWIFRLLALTGDLLSYGGIKFPMTSFRLKNMTTDNVLDLSALNEVIEDDPISRQDGNVKTFDWLCRQSDRLFE